MIPAMRMRAIQELVEERGIVTLQEIQARLEVSAMTVRRDVGKLETQGVVTRTRGGVMARHRVGLRSTYDERATRERGRKAAIGRAAAALLDAGDTVFLSGGTTVLALAAALPADLALTVITNSLLALPELMARPRITTLATGGGASGDERDLIGALALAALGRFRTRKAFVGATGITEEGVFSAHPERAAIDRLMVERSAAAHVLADHTKLGRVALERVCPLHALSGFTTDQPPPPALGRALERAGVTVGVAGDG